MLVDVMEIEYVPILHSLMIPKKFLQLYSSISLMIHLSKVQQKGNKFFHPRPTPFSKPFEMRFFLFQQLIKSCNKNIKNYSNVRRNLIKVTQYL